MAKEIKIKKKKWQLICFPSDFPVLINEGVKSILLLPIFLLSTPLQRTFCSKNKNIRALTKGS